MLHRLRFRSGQTDLRRVPVAAGVVINPGDLVYLQSGSARPASAFAWNTNAATTRSGFADVFLGIAHEPSTPGSTKDISVDVSPNSIYEVDVDTANYALGALLAPDTNSDSLEAARLTSVSAAAQAIARSAQTATSASTLRVTFASAFTSASNNVNASVG